MTEPPDPASPAALEIERLNRLLLEHEARAKSLERFIAVIGHDLRSPLSAIVMATAILGKAPLEDRAARALMRIHTSSKRAERLTRDLVDFTRARLGAGITLQRDDCDLHEIARERIAELTLANADRTVSLATAGEPRGPWDGERLGQVIASLVGHALRTSAPGTDVRVEIAADDARVRFIVQSQGPPLDATALAQLFEPFGAADDGPKHEAVGLYIASAIVRAHGGSIEARSTKSEGTTLVASVPR